MEQTLRITKALADGNRLRAVMALIDHDALCVCQITEILGHATPTVSRHMRVLQNAGLVKSRKDGRWVYYRLAELFPEQLRRWLLGSLANSEEIKSDQALLKTVLACEPGALCRQQKERKEIL